MATLQDSSTLILATFSLPAYWLARSSTMGATERQGPHQGAQKSTRTGVSLFKISPSNEASVTVFTLGLSPMESLPPVAKYAPRGACDSRPMIQQVPVPE